MACLETLERYLRDQGVPFQVQRHPLAYTAREVAASEHVPARSMAKVVMMVAGDRPIMLVLPADERVHLGAVAYVTETKTPRLAREDELARWFPDCATGAMPPFGNLYEIPVYVDEALTKDDLIYFQAGTHADTISMKYADYERLVSPMVGSFAAPVGAVREPAEAAR
ncbi:MAG TPA: YbaK/EbsC family protein [Chloroflexota bacterium]|nr:YbaK/EbsC family protein [Chloroflexota bacterium]